MGRGKPSRTGGRHDHGAMRRDGDIAPYRQAAGEGGTAMGREAKLRERGYDDGAREAKPHGGGAHEWCARAGRFVLTKETLFG